MCSGREFQIWAAATRKARLSMIRDTSSVLLFWATLYNTALRVSHSRFSRLVAVHPPLTVQRILQPIVTLHSIIWQQQRTASAHRYRRRRCWLKLFVNWPHLHAYGTPKPRSLALLGVHPDDGCGLLPLVFSKFRPFAFLQSACGRFRFRVPPSGTTCLSTSYLCRHSRFSDNVSRPFCFSVPISYMMLIPSQCEQ